MTFRRSSIRQYGCGSAKQYEPADALVGTTHEGETYIQVDYHLKKKKRINRGYKRRPIDIDCNNRILTIRVGEDEESLDLLIKVCKEIGSILEMHKFSIRGGHLGDHTKHRE